MPDWSVGNGSDETTPWSSRLGVELATPPRKKNSLATETKTREFTTTGESSNTDQATGFITLMEAPCATLRPE